MLIPFSSIAKAFQEYSFEKSELTLKADSFLTLEFYNEAKNYYQKAHRSYQKISNWSGISYTNNKMGFIEIVNKDYEESKRLLQQSEEIINNHFPNANQIKADNYMYLGILFTRTLQKDSALLYHDKGINIKKKLYGDKSLTLAESYRFKAEYLTYMVSFSLGEKLYRTAIKMYEDLLPPDHLLLAKVYSSLSSVLRRQFDYENAVIYSEKAVEILGESNSGNINSYVIALIILGNTHNEFNRFHLSVEYYDKALQLIESEEIVSNSLLYYIYIGSAINYALNDNPVEAIKFLNLFEEEFLGDGVELESIDSAFINDTYGLVYLSDNRFDRAKQYVKKSIDQFITNLGKKGYDLSAAYYTLGSIYDEGEEYDSALYYYQFSLISLLDNFNNLNIYTNPRDVNNPNAFRQYDILYKKANSLRNRSFKYNNLEDLKVALNTYTLIDKLNDYSRNSRMADASLLVLNEYFSSEYEKGIDCAYLLFNETGNMDYLDTAFILMEKSKYMLLFKSLSLAEKTQSIDLPENLKFIEDSLIAQYTNYQVLVGNEESKDNKDPELIYELRDKIFKYKKALDDLKARIQVEYPSYAQIKYDSLFKTLPDFKAYCAKNNYLGIEYYWGESDIYLIFVTEMGQSMLKIERTDEFEYALGTVLKSLREGVSFANSKEDFLTYKESAWNLYKYLLQDVITDVGIRDLGILIVPDGPLSQLPFEVLLTQEADIDYVDYKALDYLLRKYNTGYAYSANLLLNDKRKKSEIKNRLLAFSYSGSNMITGNEGRSDDQIEIPNTEIELNAIKDEVGKRKSLYYYDQNATESRFKDEAPAYHLIHLAVHGETDTANAINSRLIFKTGGDSTEDGYLYMHELYELDLSRAELAVLSACETGIGKSYIGEGVFSMARGFAYAGCPTIVMSLWRVKDQYTADLMSYFYHYINKGQDVNKSLTKSKLDFIEYADEIKAHPSNWASFVSIGESEVLVESNNFLIYLLVLATFIVLAFTIWKYRRRIAQA
jgi:CHAT domain-containing protein